MKYLKILTPILFLFLIISVFAAISAVTLNSPANDLQSTNPNITFNCTATSDLTLENISLYIDDILAYNESFSSLSESSISKEITNIAEGAHNWTCVAYDNETNSGTVAAANFTIDTIAPALFIVTPTATTYTSDIEIFDFTATDTNLDICSFSANNGVINTTVLCDTHIIGLTAIMGSNTWTIYANDSLGNENSSSVTFTRETPSTPSSSGSSTTIIEDIGNIEDSIETELETGTSYDFHVGDETHRIKISKIEGDQVKFYIRSSYIYVYVKEGETENVDLDEDGTDDFSIHISKIYYDSVDLTIDEPITETPVEEEAIEETSVETETPEQEVSTEPEVSPEEDSNTILIVIITIVIVSATIGIYFFNKLKKK